MSPDDKRQATPDGGREALDTASAPLWRRALVAFGRFWWDFLVGDTPELLIGSLVAIAAVALLVHLVGVRPVMVVALPVLVVCVLVVSSLRARTRIRARARAEGGR